MLGVVALSILLTWLVCAAVLIGIGSLFIGSLGEEFALADAFWMGIAIVVAVLEIYHFARPIDLGATILLACFGIAGLLRFRRSIVSKVRAIASAGPSACASFSFLVLLLALRSAGPCEHFDTGLYGASAIRWILTYPVVPGLANLHGRLGYNSSVFLCVAALDQGAWRDLSHHLFVGLPIAGLLAYVVPAYFRLLRGSSSSAADWFLSILILPTIYWAARAEIVGSMTDVPAAAACFAGAALLFRGLGEERSAREAASPGGERWKLRLVVAMTLFALAAVFKLSTAVVAGLGWGIALVQLWKVTRKSGKRARSIAASLLLSAGILLPWIARGMIQSGYPFYPNTALGLSADWRVPNAVGDWEAAAIRSWARQPHARLSETAGFHWFGPWLRGNSRVREGFEVPLLITTGGGIACIFAFFRKRRESRQGLWLIVPALAGCAFWFLRAPDLRFGEAPIWIFAATLGAMGIASFSQDKGPQWARIFLIGLAVTTVWSLYPRTLWRLSGQPLLNVHGFLRLPEGQAIPRRTDSGLLVYVAMEDHESKCWDTPLPCTAYFNKTLRLRRPGNMRWGFASEGFPEIPDSSGPVPGK